MAQNVEFDKFARDYSGGNEDPFKQLFGKDLDQFIRVKAKWLWNYLTKNSSQINLDANYQLLDYGCGTGEMLKLLKLFGFPGQLHGADVSQAMLAEAERRWETASRPSFCHIDEAKTDFADNSFSCIVATCVFHHIRTANRDAVLQEIKRILIPGGVLVVFEHNPFNPMTRLIVKRAIIDKDAILLQPAEMRHRLKKATFGNYFLEYIMFFPPRISALCSLEKYLSWCPLGAQYVAVGQKEY